MKLLTLEFASVSGPRIDNTSILAFYSYNDPIHLLIAVHKLKSNQFITNQAK